MSAGHGALGEGEGRWKKATQSNKGTKAPRDQKAEHGVPSPGEGTVR